jgi:hypothetical protein
MLYVHRHRDSNLHRHPLGKVGRDRVDGDGNPNSDEGSQNAAGEGRSRLAPLVLGNDKG